MPAGMRLRDEFGALTLDTTSNTFRTLGQVTVGPNQSGQILPAKQSNERIWAVMTLNSSSVENNSSSSATLTYTTIASPGVGASPTLTTTNRIAWSTQASGGVIIYGVW